MANRSSKAAPRPRVWGLLHVQRYRSGVLDIAAGSGDRKGVDPRRCTWTAAASTETSSDSKAEQQYYNQNLIAISAANTP